MDNANTTDKSASSSETNNNSTESNKETMVSEVCVFKKSNRNNQRNVRKRTMDSDNKEENEDNPVEIVRRQKTEQKGVSVANTIKPVKIETHSYSSNDNVGVKSDQFASSTYDIDGPTLDPNYPKEKVNNVDGVYRGMSGYSDFIEKKDSIQIKGLKGIKAGPVRQAANLRATSRMDYQPDLCKDYKETGYCGFGDACKFMHDRGDYKSGWQLEREWEEEQKSKHEGRSSGMNRTNTDDPKVKDEESDDLPFACFICRLPFTNPVVTKCGHYFDEDCALAHNKKSKKCYICNEPTNGIFNTPKRLVEKLTKSKAAIQNKVEETNDENE
eukprot:TRINITY_DN1545_c0_g1_i7.p1 TRINITY_DN1545_c0_g1~~TRINITY_DN1545_c0_g1_i7.p1  ORF type:complete len:328 (-),score=77.59 TRINITY_DN1545_c0_g1_i7:70-1053(-)